jgi:hypothetical protein
MSAHRLRAVGLRGWRGGALEGAGIVTLPGVRGVITALWFTLR